LRGEGKATYGSEDKKPVAKLQHQSSDGSSHNKISEYENEFTIWCIKSLDNMSAKVDGKQTNFEVTEIQYKNLNLQCLRLLPFCKTSKHPMK